MKERGLIFSAPMVRALLAGTKTQTRRLVDPKLYIELNDGEPEAPSGCILQDDPAFGEALPRFVRCPYGAPGDRLWVRETWMQFEEQGELPGGIGYRADLDHCGQVPVPWPEQPGRTVWRTPKDPWRPSIHMPRWASRITLEITEVRVQRLQEIREEDAKAEGARRYDDIPDPHPYKKGLRWSMESPTSTDQCLGSARMAFAAYWNQLHGADAWDANPWVWALTFRRLP